MSSVKNMNGISPPLPQIDPWGVRQFCPARGACRLENTYYNNGHMRMRRFNDDGTVASVHHYDERGRPHKDHGPAMCLFRFNGEQHMFIFYEHGKTLDHEYRHDNPYERDCDDLIDLAPEVA